jgi:hypothetical protein
MLPLASASRSPPARNELLVPVTSPEVGSTAAKLVMLPELRSAHRRPPAPRLARRNSRRARHKPRSSGAVRTRVTQSVLIVRQPGQTT